MNVPSHQVSYLSFMCMSNKVCNVIYYQLALHKTVHPEAKWVDWVQWVLTAFFPKGASRKLAYKFVYKQFKKYFHKWQCFSLHMKFSQFCFQMSLWGRVVASWPHQPASQECSDKDPGEGDLHKHNNNRTSRKYCSIGWALLENFLWSWGKLVSLYSGG